MELLVKEGFLKRQDIMVGRAIRRILYTYMPLVILYRTQVTMMFYAKAPSAKTPDPIAEFRVTAVSQKPGQYDIEEFKRACIYVGVVLASQTYWMKQEVEITADEKDEPIDTDELRYSVPAYQRLNFAERYAVFFRSRRDEDRKWKNLYPYWWTDPNVPRPSPDKGDFEYDEKYIRDLELKKILLGALKMKFDNERGIVESVEY
jgi:hypothetical protein